MSHLPPTRTLFSLRLLRRRHSPGIFLPLLLPRALSTTATTAATAGTVCPSRGVPPPLVPPSQPHQKNPHDLIKEDPIEICSELWVRSYARGGASSLPFANLTGFLKKFDLWILAYQRSCAHATGSSFPPRNAIHLPTLRSLLSLQQAVLSGRFVWGASTHLHIRAPNDLPSTKPVSKRRFRLLLENAGPPFQDRVVQELLLLLLEPVFEPRFSDRSHAFRPGRSPHTVLRTIRSNFAGYLWFIKGDLTAVSQALEPDLVVGCLEKGVKDRKVLGLIRSALQRTHPVRTRAAHSPQVPPEEKDQRGSKLSRKRVKRKTLTRLSRRRKKLLLKENEPKPDPYWLRAFFSFAPEEAAEVPRYGHCGILSPLLANICLSELDAWVEEKIVGYFCPSKLDSIWRESITDGCHNPAWPEFVPSSGRKEKTRRMDYIRYGSRFLIGIRGPREDAVEMRKELMDFCEKTYGRRLENNTSIEIEHITRGIQFLDHVICRRVVRPTLRYTGTGGRIVSEKGVGTLLSVTASLQRCISRFRDLELLKGGDGEDPEPLPCNPMLYSGQAHTNSQMNKFLETMADWYRYADNRKKVVGFCAYVIRSSLAKLYAARYRLKSRAKVYGIASRDLSRPLIRRNASAAAAPQKEEEYSSDLLSRMGGVTDDAAIVDGVRFSRASSIPPCDYTPFPRGWMPGHVRLLREHIRLQDPKFLCRLLRSVAKRREEDLRLATLSPPQDDMSRTVWGCKALRGTMRRPAKQPPPAPSSSSSSSQPVLKDA